MAKRGLGKGLSALISDLPEESSVGQIKIVPINEIEPNKEQPRKNFDEEKLEELSQSIKEHGIIQPLIVKKQGGFYVIVAGERRWRAARMAGLSEVPVIIQDYSNDEVMEISLIENLQREDLNPIEEAKAYETLIHSFSLKQEEVAKRVGKSRSAIANTLRLLQLDESIQELLVRGSISEGHARALLALPGKEEQIIVVDKILKDNLSVRETEKLIKDILEKPRKKKKNEAMPPIFKEIENKMKNILGTKVQITKGRKKGKIEIEYYSDEDLERILYLIQSIENRGSEVK
ncbi:MAG: ParB family transcriptional regulator, chromosome partitioning protein [Epulopiscium sp.]|nr:ParB/RepB/Spo0J family partition protein [Defluviitalea raffinosedens]MBM7686044.1 ParB family chromosome partitioning protein [Defluviitalea raffinosedens]MBZ4667669.1 parB-like partition protein [Defluviitaleaceae bacterium]MDK2787016.1 ParB family transcriptional regulator, chromosome partitioning protein [Candidatus Epulonipiscium sp.]